MLTNLVYGSEVGSRSQIFRSALHEPGVINASQEMLTGLPELDNTFNRPSAIVRTLAVINTERIDIHDIIESLETTSTAADAAVDHR